MDEVMDLGDFDLHESLACGGIASDCLYCKIEDIVRAERIKDATRRIGYSSVATESAE